MNLTQEQTDAGIKDFILVENGTQWDITTAERDYLVLQDMIYYCGDDNMYHTWADLDEDVIDVMVARAQREANNEKNS